MFTANEIGKRRRVSKRNDKMNQHDDADEP
jgi:hypothetical protein